MAKTMRPLPAGDSGPSGSDRLKAWYQASRPPFYIATLVPIVLGLVLAARDTGQWRIGRFLLVNLGAFLVHLSTNLANDLFDHILGADAGESIGGSRVIQEGLISPSTLVGVLIFLDLAALAIAWGVIRHIGQPGLWILVAVAGFSALFYVAPPIRYGYHGLGELSVFVNMGLIITGGTYWVQAGKWQWSVCWYALPVGLMVAGILYFQSLPDMNTDRQAGKKTLAVRLGRRRALTVFRLGWILTYISLIGLWAAGMTAWLVGACLLTLPVFLKADRLIRTTEDWLELDRHGHLVRKLYLANGVLLILSVALL